MFQKASILLWFIIISIIPINAYSLGFGKIKTNSALNEIMDADIPLLATTESDINSLEVSLASREVFQRFGTDRPNMLTQLKFEVKQKSGLYYIKVTSKQVIREPFLDFWLEMNSKNGRYLREFVVLLDPPHLRQPEPASVIETPVALDSVSEFEPEALIEDDISEPQVSPFTEPEPSILDENLAIAAEENIAEPEEALITDQVETIDDAEESLIIEPDAVDLIEEPNDIEDQGSDVAVAGALLDGTNDEQVEEFVELDSSEPESVIAAEEILEPESESEIIVDEDLTAEELSAASFAEDEGLFPRIPLSQYSEPTEESFNGQPEDVTEETLEPLEPNDPNNEFVETEEPIETQTAGDLDYGITKKNDNLWQIAQKLQSGNSNASVYQIMMALLQSNPEAFVENNVHRLKVGHVLRVEDPELLSQISRGQASQMYQSQTEQWENYRSSIASNIDTQAVDTSDLSFQETSEFDQEEGELTLTTPDGTENELSAGIEESDNAQLTDLANLRIDLKKAITEASSATSQSPELSERLLLLEDEINSMQRILTVEDDELASLQQQLHEINERNALIDESRSAQEIPEDVGEPLEIDPDQLIAAIDDVDNEIIDEVAVVDTIEENADELTPLADAEEPGMIAMVTAMVTGLLASVIDNLIYVAVVLGVLILLVVVMVVLKKRNADNDDMNESILIGSEDNDLSSISAMVDESSEPISTGIDSTSSEESSFLSDFAISGMNAIEEDNEVDPLTEADVFMAYGRYEAAEERLQDAIKIDPNRSELKLKLIELYYTIKNKESFESTAEEFYAALGGNASLDPMWEKVLSMGAEFAPDNPIFSGGTPLTDGLDVSSATMNKSDVMDIGLDTGVFDSADLSSSSTGDKTAEATSDYNFDLGIDTTGDLGGDVSKEKDSSNGLDFDLDLDTKDDINSDIGSLDFNLDSVESTEEMDTRSGSMEFELGSSAEIEPESELMDLGLGADSNVNTSTDIDASGLDFDLPTDNIEDDIDFSTGLDEVGTKLDLAKAYIDMGDSNGARSILDEVIDEGNDSQKQEAQELIHQIV